MSKLLKMHPKRIAIFRALQLGDLLCSVPAIRALKKALPQSEITLIGLPWAAGFVKRFSAYLSGFTSFPGYPGLVEQPFHPQRFISFLQQLQKEPFDLVIQMHGNGSVINPMIAILGASRTAGFYVPGTFIPDGELFMPYPEGAHEITKQLLLMEFLGIPAQGTHLEFPVAREEEHTYRQLCASLRIRSGKYVCIHGGARDKSRRWSPAKFAYIADVIARRGYQILLTGTAAEHEIAGQIQKAMQFPAVNLAGKTELGLLALLVRNARMLFSNDTGISHIAAAMRTPSIILFLASDPDRWAPLDKTLHHRILPHESESVNTVLQQVETLL